MSIWGGITGGLLGFVVLGPIGALVGSVIGSNLSSRSKRKRPNNFDKQVFQLAIIPIIKRFGVRRVEIKVEIKGVKIKVHGEYRSQAP